MNFKYPQNHLQKLKNVTKVLTFNDDDNSANDGIRLVRRLFPEAELVFATVSTIHLKIYRKLKPAAAAMYL